MAFSRLKEALCSHPILVTPDCQVPMLVQTDAYDMGLGAILSQMHNVEEHLTCLQGVLDVIRQAELTANPKKCKLGFEEVEYLVYLIGRGNVQERKVHTVRDLPVPLTKTQVKSFLGLAGYYRRFIPNFAAIASPLPI